MAIPENTFLHLGGIDSPGSLSRSADGVVSKESASKWALEINTPSST